MSTIEAVGSVAITIVLTVFAQLAIKWQVLQLVKVSEILNNKVAFVVDVLTKPMAIIGLISALTGVGFWIAAMSRLPLSLTYPFMSLTIPLVMFSSSILFGETLNWQSFGGAVLVMAGLIVLASS
jgi:drug/metabolite transporter (DMT)-like permease